MKHPRRKINLKNSSQKKHISKWSSIGGGMSKHRKSGNSGTNRNVLLKRCKKFNEELKKNKKHAQKMYDSFQELFNNYNK